MCVCYCVLYTLGPAGPPLHRGVFEVPQSTHVLTFEPSDETLSGVGTGLPMSSHSEPCDQQKHPGIN